LFIQNESGVIRGTYAVSLITIRKDSNALQLGHLGVGAAALEVCAEDRVRIDLLLLPHAGRSAGPQDDAVARDERIARPVAGRAGRSLRAPHQLERIPAHAALPGDVHARRA